MDDELFRQFSDQLRLQSSNLSNSTISNSIWSPNRPEERHNLDLWSSGGKSERLNLDLWSVGGKSERQNLDVLSNAGKSGRKNLDIRSSSGKPGRWKDTRSDYNSFNSAWPISSGIYPKGSSDISEKETTKSSHRKNSNYNPNIKIISKDTNDGETKKNKSGSTKNNSADRKLRTLPASESLPRNEAVGGYIFVCNNDTMEENLRRRLFGLPSRYRDSVRAITPGLPLFLYNYTTHQLHGIFEAASFGGTNMDPTAWEDKKCPGESRFPAQVRVATRKTCEPLEEDSFRPVLHHYDGPKFRLELNVPEALALLDIFADKNSNR